MRTLIAFLLLSLSLSVWAQEKSIGHELLRRYDRTVEIDQSDPRAHYSERKPSEKMSKWFAENPYASPMKYYEIYLKELEQYKSLYPFERKQLMKIRRRAGNAIGYGQWVKRNTYRLLREKVDRLDSDLLDYLKVAIFKWYDWEARDFFRTPKFIDPKLRMEIIKLATNSKNYFDREIFIEAIVTRKNYNFVDTNFILWNLKQKNRWRETLFALQAKKKHDPEIIKFLLELAKKDELKGIDHEKFKQLQSTETYRPWEESWDRPHLIVFTLSHFEDQGIEALEKLMKQVKDKKYKEFIQKTIREMILENVKKEKPEKVGQIDDSDRDVQKKMPSKARKSKIKQKAI
jgi:hypothetical protein